MHSLTANYKFRSMYLYGKKEKKTYSAHTEIEIVPEPQTQQ